MLLLKPLPLSLLLLLLSGYTEAVLWRREEDLSSELHYLNNDRGETPCDMASKLVGLCANPAKRNEPVGLRASFPLIRRSLCGGFGVRDGEVDDPSPNNCTCTNVFFNVWQACLYLHHNSSLLKYSDWDARCSDGSVRLSPGVGSPAKNNVVDIPRWAWLDPTDADSTFNVTRAILDANMKPQKSWTLMQVLIAPIVGISTIAIMGLIFFIYHSKSPKKKTWPRAILHFLLPCRVQRLHNVHYQNRDGTWSIEYPGEIENSGRDSVLPAEHGRRGSSSTQNTLQTVEPERRMPGKASWRRFKSLVSNRVLHLNRPQKVKSRPRPEGFKLDDRDNSTLHSHSPKLSESRNGGWPDDDSFEDSGDEQWKNGNADEESHSLISPAERDEDRVFVIAGRRGQDFTSTTETGGTSTWLSNQFHVVSPTNSSHYSYGSLLFKPTKPKPKRPRLPPPPRQPAPLPPVRVEQPTSQLRALPTMPPISEHRPSLSTSSASRSQETFPNSAVNLTASPARPSNQLGAPPPNSHIAHIPPGAAPPVIVHPQTTVHQSSSPATSRYNAYSSMESLYLSESERSQGRSQPPPSASSSSLRLPASENVRAITPAPERPALTVNAPQISQRFMGAPGDATRLSVETHLRPSAHHRSVSSDAVPYADPLRQQSDLSLSSNLIPHRRVLSADERPRGDNQSGISLSSGPARIARIEPLRADHPRAISPEILIPSRADPAMLFPASVRAAGYVPSSPEPTYSSASVYSSDDVPRPHPAYTR